MGQATIEIGGVDLPIRTNLGIYTQPLSFIGLPVLAAPVARGGLPVGVQLIGAPWSEVLLFQVASRLERAGVVAATPPAFVEGA